MDHIALATRAGVTLHDLNELIKGNVTMAVANRVGGGVSIGDLHAFIEGRAAAAVTTRFGFTNMAEQVALVHEIGPKGAIGFLIGELLRQ